MPQSVRYTATGGPEVLELVDTEPPQPEAGEVRVRVVTAGLNPVDYKIFTGRAPHFPTPLPSGVGNDFAGVVDAVGEGVTEWAVGDAVYGGARHKAIAEYVVVPAKRLHAKPANLSWEQAGSLDIAARTAAAVVSSVNVTAGDIVVVSAAAGGVGVIVSQLAVRLGATVIGTAGPANHEFLRSLGVTPVTYGEGLVERLREAAPEGIAAVCDQHGVQTLEAALELGVNPSRVNTIAAKPFAAEHGFSTSGGADAQPGDLEWIADLAASGNLQLPIDRVFSLADVREAYEYLMAGHLRGKVVLSISAA